MDTYIFAVHYKKQVKKSKQAKVSKWITSVWPEWSAKKSVQNKAFNKVCMIILVLRMYLCFVTFVQFYTQGVFVYHINTFCGWFLSNNCILDTSA